MEIEFTNITEIINYIKELAPEVWGIYVQQAILVGVRQFVWAGVTFILSLICFIVAKAGYTVLKEDGDDVIFFIALAIILMSVLSVVTIGYIMEGATMLINPEYAAIQMLLGK